MVNFANECTELRVTSGRGSGEAATKFWPLKKAAPCTERQNIDRHVYVLSTKKAHSL